MISEDTKARIWMWWPYLAGLVIFAATIGAVFYFLPKGGNSGESGPQIDLKELSSVPAFRAAYIKANGGEQKLESLQGILSSGTFEELVTGHVVMFAIAHPLVASPSMLQLATDL